MTNLTNDNLFQRAMDLHLWGLVSNWEKLGTHLWVPQLLEAEEAERKKRSLERRISNAHLGPFRYMTNFDWNWPRKINRELIEEIFTLETLKKPINIVLIGPNGVGKTMIAMNLAYQALLRGATVCFTTGSAMLNDLASQQSGTALQRRLKRYVNPSLLVIDEVGYLSYDNRHADLLFEVVSRRYQHLPIILTTNRLCGAPHKRFNADRIVMQSFYADRPVNPLLWRGVTPHKVLGFQQIDQLVGCTETLGT